MVSTFRDIKSRQWWLCVEMLASEEFADTEILAKLDLWYMIQNIEIFALKIRRKTWTTTLLYFCNAFRDVNVIPLSGWSNIAETYICNSFEATAMQPNGKKRKNVEANFILRQMWRPFECSMRGPKPIVWHWQAGSFTWETLFVV